MPWGYDEWLMDREGRKRWLRSIGLAALGEQILRTPALAEEGLACILDEVSGNGELGPDVRALVNADVASAERWSRAALEASRAAGVVFQSLAVLLPDGPPYELELAFVNAPAVPDVDWTDEIVWRFGEGLRLRALEVVLESLSPEVLRDGDYILPLGYSAFVTRDVLCALGSEALAPATTAIVSYQGGDALAVPLER